MKGRVAIVDTNVLVAGLLTHRADSPAARVLDGMLRGAFPFVLSEALLAEYRNVLERPNLRKLHGLNDDEVEVLLTEIAQCALIVAPAVAVSAPDAGDQLLWDLLAARPDLVLVTGDKLLQNDAGMRGRVQSPGEFLAGL